MSLLLEMSNANAMKILKFWPILILTIIFANCYSLESLDELPLPDQSQKIPLQAAKKL